MHVGNSGVYTTFRQCLYTFLTYTSPSRNSRLTTRAFALSPQKGLSPLKKAKGGNHVQVIFHTVYDLNRNPRLRKWLGASWNDQLTRDTRHNTLSAPHSPLEVLRAAWPRPRVIHLACGRTIVTLTKNRAAATSPRPLRVEEKRTTASRSGNSRSLPELSRFPPQKSSKPTLKKAKGGNHVQVIFHTGCNFNRNPRLRMPSKNVGKGRAYAMFRRLNPLKKAKGGNHSGIVSDWTNPFSPQTMRK